MHDNNLYVGLTTDLRRRLTERFHGESNATAPRRPFRLVFCESPDILQTGRGRITWTNINPSLYYTLEWRNALTNGTRWQSVYSMFRDVQSQEDTITLDSSTFFRVRTHDAPEYMRYMTATSHVMEAGYYEVTNLVTGNIRSGVTIFGVAGKTEVVDTASGDAEAGAMLADRVGR